MAWGLCTSGAACASQDRNAMTLSCVNSSGTKASKCAKKRAKKSMTVDATQQNIASLKESDLNATLGQGGNEKVTLSYMLKAMEGTSTKNVVNKTALMKQVKSLKKDNEKRPTLDKPVSARKNIRQE